MLPDPIRLVTCNACGWVHVAVTREYAEHAVASFNTWYREQSPQTQEQFGREASLERDYMRCDSCGGGHVDFSPAKDEDCPQGCTLGPIIQEA